MKLRSSRFILGFVFLISLSIDARQVFKGESLWIMQQLVTEASCDATIIQAAMPLTITQPGVYCFAEALSGQITIATSGVVLDLNRKILSGGVIINAGLNNIAIENGTITNGTQGIAVGSGCSEIAIIDITAEQCDQGININNANIVSVEHCLLVSNNTGFSATQCSRMQLHDCQAVSNIQAGFSLVSSTTNCFIGCKAISTGQGATGDVFGFVTTDGSANIFEECIANSTLSLTTTSTNNIVAGIAFLGTEQCSKIIDGEFANTVAGGSATAYGIFLSSTTTTTITLTEKTSINSGGTLVSGVRWSPNGKFLAVADSAALQIYEALSPSQLLLLDSQPISNGIGISKPDWASNGRFIVVNTPGFLSIYEFDCNTLTLTLRSSTAVTGLDNNARWSPDGNYLAFGTATPNGSINAALFNQITGTFAITSTVAFVPGANTGTAIESVGWSPDGLFVVVGGESSGAVPAANRRNLAVYAFSAGTLTFSASTSYGNTVVFATEEVNSVDWSSSAGIDYIAAGGFLNISGFDVEIFHFIRSPASLTLVAAANNGAPAVFDVNWSSQGDALVLGGEANATPQNVFVYSFNTTTPALTFVTGTLFGTGATNVFTTQWKPGNTCIAVGGDLVAGPPAKTVSLYSGLIAESSAVSNVVKNNLVYCTGLINLTRCAADSNGIGINGNSDSNLIISNTAYNNIINYNLVNNVYAGGLNGTPGLLQNISVPPL